MEIWPHKFDWQKFLANYHREGEPKPRGKWKALSLKHTDYVDSQSTNGAFVDAFRLLRDRLPADIGAPLGDFVAAISTVNLPDFPYLPDETLPGEDLSNEEEMSNIRSPETVRRVADGLAAIDDARMLSALTAAWPAIAKQESKWVLYEPERIADPAEFLDYLSGWRAALAEIADGGYGMGICGG